MTGVQDLVALMPADSPVATETGPGLLERLRGAVGQGRLVFPCLAADPSGLAGVLLTSRGDPGQVTVNGQPAKVLWSQNGQTLLDPEPFCRWENVLRVRCDAKSLRLDPVVKDAGAAETLGLPQGTAWRLQSLSGKDLGRLVGPAKEPSPQRSVIEELAQGLAAMVSGTGDVWSFFDLVDGSYRLAGWRWDTGIVLEALAAAAEILPGGSSLAAARTVGDRLLASQLNHPECSGGFPEWVDMRYSEQPCGVSQWVAPFNAAFISAGLVRLAKVCGQPAYSQAARQSLRLAATRGLTRAGGLSGYYFEESRKWRYLGQINDSGILGRGLALFPDEDWTAESAVRAYEYILGKAGQTDGHIARAWWDPVQAAPAGSPLFPEWKRHPDRVVAKIFLRGQAWVLLGLAGALRLGADEKLASAARRLAAFIVEAQQPDGSWLYSGLQPQLGSCAKTTAALALALAEWSAAAGDHFPAPAVHRGLRYLETCRRPGMAPAELSGLPVDTSQEGCIIYFRDRPVVCAYTAALELLARVAVGEGL